MMPHSSSPSPNIDKAVPTGSGRLGVGLRELGTSQTAATSPRRPTGTLIKKTEPHQKWANSKPPRIGPRATPRPVVPDQIPMARTRSFSSVNTLVRIERVQGIRPAAPTPITARANIRRSGLTDSAASADPPAKTTSPARKIHFRPTLSPRAPIESNKPAKTTA